MSIRIRPHTATPDRPAHPLPPAPDDSPATSGPTPDSTVLSAHAGVTVHHDAEPLGQTWTALFTSTGIWLVPEELSQSDEVPARLCPERMTIQRAMLTRPVAAFNDTGAPDLTGWPGSIWVAEADLAGVRVHGAGVRKVDLVDPAGVFTTLRLPAMGNAPSLGRVAFHALAEMVGERLRVG